MVTSEVLCVADELFEAEFGARAAAVDVVCAGDSITGWNNFGRRRNWPFPTYPEFLQSLCRPLGLSIADGGMAGEVSDNGLEHVRRYLRTFPSARYFVIGFGTNDLGMWGDLESTSQGILDNYDAMLEAVRGDSRVPMLLNVPDANESLFTPDAAADLRRRRDYHNDRLAEYCLAHKVPLVDIRRHLSTCHLGDQLHPNEQGARVIADCVFEVLRGVCQADGSAGES